MPENKKYIIANWKMNPVSLALARKLIVSVSGESKKKKKLEMVICPPHIFLCLASDFPGLKFGAQNVFWEDQGAYTGEISGSMLKKFGVDYVIVGHSERRKYFGETDASVNLKIQACLKKKLKPVVCIGEIEKGREEQIKKQLEPALLGISKSQLKNILIVYEPVWAISANSHGVAASVDDALAGLLFIKKILVNLFNQRSAKQVKILYGGSVNGGNAAVFINQVGFDGALVGNASLDKKEFVRIMKSV